MLPPASPRSCSVAGVALARFPFPVAAAWPRLRERTGAAVKCDGADEWEAEVVGWDADMRGETTGDGGQDEGEAGAADDEADDGTDSCMS